MTDPGYWVEHVRRPVRFLDGIRALAGQGVTRFLELGPDAVLTAMAGQCLDEAGDVAFVPALRAGKPEADTFAGFLGRAHVVGVAVDWAAFYAGSAASRVDLPTYAFDRRRFWLDDTGGSAHPMLDTTVEVAESGGLLLSGRLSRTRTPWLADHAVGGRVLLPGTAFVELASQAAAAAGAEGIDQLTLLAPLVLPASGVTQLQLAVGDEDERGQRTIAIHARPAGEPGADWTRHATGLLGPVAELSDVLSPDAGDSWPPAGAEPLDLGTAYQRLADAGYDYGPAFRGLVAAWSAGSDRYVEVRLPSGVPADGYALHPALLDAVLHVLVLQGAEDGEGMLLPFAWSGVRIARTGPDTLRVRLSRSVDGEFTIALSDGHGRALGGVAALSLRAGQAAPAGTGLQRVDWVRTPFEPVADA